MAKKTFQLLPEPASSSRSSAKLQIDVPTQTIAILDEAKQLCGLSRKALITHLFCNVLTPMLQEEIERRKAAQGATQFASDAMDFGTLRGESAVQKNTLPGSAVVNE